MPTQWTDTEVQTETMRTNNVVNIAGDGPPNFPQGLGVSPGAIPLGAIISVDDRWSNVTVPASGVIDSFGFQICDGSAAAAGHGLGSGATNVPNLSDGRFLRGATSSGATGGSDSVNISISNMPSHSHGVTDPGHTHSHSLSSNVSLTGTTSFASVSHTHAPGSMVAATGVLAAGGGVRWRPDSTNQAVLSTWSGNGQFGIGSGGVSGDDLINPVRIKNSTAGPSASASVGLSNNSLTGSISGSSTGITTQNQGSGTSLSVIPKYFTVKYLMRVK